MGMGEEWEEQWRWCEGVRPQYIWKAEPAGFAGRLGVECEREKSRVTPRFWPGE